MIVYASSDLPDSDALLALYNSVGWSAYTRDPERLQRAVRGSSFVVTARNRDRLIGLARTVSDDVSITYLQDVLVAPDHQRRGVGRELLTRVLERYAHVRQTVLMTDSETHQLAFYRSLGFVRIGDENAPGNAFLLLRDRQGRIPPP